MYPGSHRLYLKEHSSCAVSQTHREKQCWKGKLNIYDEKMNEFSKNYTRAVPFAKILKESWEHKCLAALSILLYRLPPHIGGVAYILQLTFFRQFCQSWTLFFFLERFNSNTVAGGCHLRIIIKKTTHTYKKENPNYAKRSALDYIFTTNILTIFCTVSITEQAI